MSNTITLKKSSIAGKVPAIGDLGYGELALNYADGKLYYKKSDGSTIDFFKSGAGSSSSDYNTLTNVPAFSAKTFMLMGA